jgi:hypothetical protein
MEGQARVKTQMRDPFIPHATGRVRPGRCARPARPQWAWLISRGPVLVGPIPRRHGPFYYFNNFLLVCFSLLIRLKSDRIHKNLCKFKFCI